MSQNINSEKEGPGLIFRALRYRNYRIFFTGQVISLTGTWMQQMAVSWLVYRLTGSVFMLGVVGFASQIPIFLLSPFAGVLADRFRRKRILIITQVLAMLQALALAWLVMSGAIEVWHIIAASLFLGVVFAFDIPARHSFVIEMVDERNDIGNAIALNSIIFNFARLIGPSIAGIAISLAGEGACFLLNGISYTAVIYALKIMDIAPPGGGNDRTPIFQGLKDGISYAFRSDPIRSVLVLVGISSFMGVSYIVLMPAFARDVLGGGPYTLGFLIGSSGVGALAGGVYLASQRGVGGLGKTIVASTFVFAFGLIAFSLSRVFWLSLLFMLFAGFGVMVQMASGNTLLQSLVDDDKRGRVMSLFAMSFLGMAPFGSLFAGLMASALGSPATLTICAVSLALSALVFRRRLFGL